MECPISGGTDEENCSTFLEFVSLSWDFMSHVVPEILGAMRFYIVLSSVFWKEIECTQRGLIEN